MCNKILRFRFTIKNKLLFFSGVKWTNRNKKCEMGTTQISAPNFRSHREICAQFDSVHSCKEWYTSKNLRRAGKEPRKDTLESSAVYLMEFWTDFGWNVGWRPEINTNLTLRQTHAIFLTYKTKQKQNTTQLWTCTDKTPVQTLGARKRNRRERAGERHVARFGDVACVCVV
jgi:hypothetical protein